MEKIDHPIFLESIRYIRGQLGETGLAPLEQQVLERLLHSSGDFGLKPLLRFSRNACQVGLAALQKGAPILTDTEMAAAAVRPMSFRTLKSSVHSVLEWVPKEPQEGMTRTALGMKLAWEDLLSDGKETQAPIVLIGSAPTALITLLDLVSQGATPPSLVIGMPVGFIGVIESKNRLYNSNLPSISLVGTRGGAALAASVINALLRAAFYST